MKRQQALELLGLSEAQINVPNKSAVLKAAYRKRALACHPDKNPDNPAAQKNFTDLTKAYEKLASPEDLPRAENGDVDIDEIFRDAFGDNPFPNYEDLREQPTEDIVREFMWGEKGKEDPGKDKYAVTLMLSYRRFDTNGYALTGYTVLRHVKENSLAELKNTIQNLLYDRNDNPLRQFSAKCWFGKEDGKAAIVDILLNHQHLFNAHFGVDSAPISKDLDARLQAHVDKIRNNTEDWQMKFAKAFEKREVEKKSSKKANNALKLTGTKKAELSSEEPAPRQEPARRQPAGLPKHKKQAPPKPPQDEDMPVPNMHWHSDHSDKPPYQQSVLGASVAALLLYVAGYSFIATVLASMVVFGASYIIRKNLQSYACVKSREVLAKDSDEFTYDEQEVFNLGVDASTSNEGWLKSWADKRTYDHYGMYLAGKHLRDHSDGIDEDKIRMKARN
ncbi:MAG: DnaJ domain-containing protein [Proteobacteria bacterium]|nr:DnaJ domain-containing protein [Pseudomonadota bacterium]